MKPSVIADSNGRGATAAGTATNNNGTSSNGMNIPVNHQYGGVGGGGGGGHQQPSSHSGYNSPSSGRQFPHHFQQSFGFDPDIDNMFSDTGLRSRLGNRMQDPFGTFGSRKRCGNEPHQSGSSYFDDDPDFFPQFGTLGNRRRAGTGSGGPGVGNAGIPNMDTGTSADRDDFFDRLPPEFRQYIPEGFGMGHHRRSGSTGPQSPRAQQQQQPQYAAPQYYPNVYNPQPDATGVQTSSSGCPQSPKILRDAAIQTEVSQHPIGGDAIDGHLNQHGLRNTVDLGVKSAPEEQHGMRAQSAPPNEQPTTSTMHARGIHQNTPPPQHNNANFSSQTSPQVMGGGEPNIQRTFYPTQNQSQPQQQQQQQPSTPGGSYIRTIPIFVEGRSEPIINSHKEIPNQSQTAPATSVGGKGYPQPRPTPLNTQQAAAAECPTDGYTNQASEAGGIPPQTPHTMESINKIQDIQRDVLALMGKVEKFSGTRQDKEYAYLDEMLTRNLLKLDTIDTNGKESIRMARKEAIKCIQASINVLEAKAEGNAAKAAAGSHAMEGSTPPQTNDANASEMMMEDNVAPSIDNQTAIPLPPPPDHHKESSSSDQSKDREGSKTAETSTGTEMVVDAKTE